MGLLVEGRWQDQWYDTAAGGGRFLRKDSAFRDWITPDGAPGPDGARGFPAEPGRYHLYVSLACPWAHRTLIVRALKGLEATIPVSVVHWRMLEEGWTFADGPGVVPDPIGGGARLLHEVYTRADPRYTGRVTVPVLWDIRRGTIVNNESSEIIRMFNAGFDALGARPGDFYPAPLRAAIDAVNARIYDTVNNGVYKAGFATTQAAYEEAVAPLFGTLDWLEARLATRRYLMGAALTEADIRLFTTLVRFDAVYHGHFKCNLRPIAAYPVLSAYPPRPLRNARLRLDRRHGPHQGPLLREPPHHQPDGDRATRAAARLFRPARAGGPGGGLIGTAPGGPACALPSQSRNTIPTLSRGKGGRHGDTAIPTPRSLDEALAAASPRLSPPPTPWASLLVHGGILALWLALLARAVLSDGLFAWSVGLAYVTYDTALLGVVFWQTRGLAAPPPALPARAPRAETLGVVVAARDEAAGLPATLAALFAQDEPPQTVIVADDGSADGTGALLEGAFGLPRPALGMLSAPSATHPTLRWLRLPHGGKPVALNAAIERLDTALLLTVDADTLLQPGAVAAMRRAFAADPRLVAATGVLSPLCAPTLSGRLFQWFQSYEYIRNFLSRYAWMRLDSLLLISGAFAGFRTDAVRAVGGFDPACLVEDYELIHRLRRHGTLRGLGWTTAVLGEARATTDAPAALRPFLRQRRRWFGGFLQTQFWYRDMVGNPAYGRLGLFMLPVKAADTLQPLYGLAAFALLVGYALTGRFVLFGSVLGVMSAKLLIDMAFHLWSIHLYRRWAGAASTGFGRGLLAALAEPFSFQLLRHLGAALGWVVFLTGRRSWGVQHRPGARPSDGTAPRGAAASSADP